MDREKREKNISNFAKRLAENDHRYMQVFREIHDIASENGVHPDEIQTIEKYPDDYEW